MPTICVTGDLTVDWTIVVPTGSGAALVTGYAWERSADVHISALPGGGVIVRDLLAAANLPGLTVRGPAVPEQAMADPSDDSLPRSFTQWQPMVKSIQGGGFAWRMSRFLGMRPVGAAAGGFSHLSDEDLSADVLVIDDAGHGFRTDTGCAERLAAADILPGRVILKMAGPLGTGPLWDGIVARLADRTTLYCAVSDLRREQAPIGQALSWELTATEVAAAVMARPDLRLVDEVVVALDQSGAVLVPREGAATLIYDPRHQEGDWAAARPGVPTGLGSCITAALALAAARSPDRPRTADAVVAGLHAARALHERGLDVPPSGSSGGPKLPLGAIAEVLVGGIERGGDGDDTFNRVAIPAERSWRILTAVAPPPNVDLAARLAIEGDEAVARGIPMERMGTWSSLDRVEIESMRSVRTIVGEYLAQERRTRPLSIAVFGPPGSGKSFAIKQMAKEWSAGPARIATLEFNLSQFAGSEDLSTALQRVRDRAVEQTLPLVFWDEFDSKAAGLELGWLVRFLAPMQDGVFLEKGATQPVGPAIFVFAGGTHATMESFKTRAVEVPGAKASDFLSRLRGYVDVLGPNPSGPDDDTAPLRRAILLRTLLRFKAPALIQGGNRLAIDPGVLRAFLQVGTFVHGARSLESIIDMSSLAGRLRFERAALPAPHQLGLHVDPDEFLSLVAEGRSALGSRG